MIRALLALVRLLGLFGAIARGRTSTYARRSVTRRAVNRATRGLFR